MTLGSNINLSKFSSPKTRLNPLNIDFIKLELCQDLLHTCWSASEDKRAAQIKQLPGQRRTFVQTDTDNTVFPLYTSRQVLRESKWPTGKTPEWTQPQEQLSGLDCPLGTLWWFSACPLPRHSKSRCMPKWGEDRQKPPSPPL